jgi:hypothetical protein
MGHHVHTPQGEEQGLAVSDVSSEKLNISRQIRRQTVRVHLRVKVIEDTYLKPLLQETIDEVRADESCSPRHEDFHP